MIMMSRPNTYRIIRRYPDERVVYINNVPDENSWNKTNNQKGEKLNDN